MEGKIPAWAPTGAKHSRAAAGRIREDREAAQRAERLSYALAVCCGILVGAVASMAGMLG